MALAEMSFAGQWGLDIDLTDLISMSRLSPTEQLFSESNSRFVVEVPAESERRFQESIGDVVAVRLGTVKTGADCCIRISGQPIISIAWQKLFHAWHHPLDWA